MEFEFIQIPTPKYSISTTTLVTSSSARGLYYFHRTPVIINSEIEKTAENIHEYKELTKPEAPDVAIGRISRMDAINNRSVLEAALRKSEERLKALQYVKGNINDDSFGFCAGCQQEIPVRRILIRPESRYCVRCAQ